MNSQAIFRSLVALATLSLTHVIFAQATTDPLPSWNSGPTKSAIVAFVQRVTTPGTPGFVPVDQRVATFDNDGTLWSEQPVYFQAQFALDYIKEMAPTHPEWQTTEPYKSVLAGDLKAIMASGKKGLVDILAVSHVGMTDNQFAASVAHWLATAKHPVKHVPYTQMVFQPMLELLAYLRANDFKTYIVSGGGTDFMRVFAEKTYGIPPEQVIGSIAQTQFEMRDGIPTIVKTDKLILVNDKVGKPMSIYRHIGRRPIFAAGNSDGDIEMLEYTTIAHDNQDTTPRFGMIVHHDDAKNEWAYDRKSPIGNLDKGLDMVPKYGWHVVSMKDDWRQVFPDARD